MIRWRTDNFARLVGLFAVLSGAVLLFPPAATGWGTQSSGVLPVVAVGVGLFLAGAAWLLTEIGADQPPRRMAAAAVTGLFFALAAYSYLRAGLWISAGLLALLAAFIWSLAWLKHRQSAAGQPAVDLSLALAGAAAVWTAISAWLSGTGWGVLAALLLLGGLGLLWTLFSGRSGSTEAVRSNAALTGLTGLILVSGLLLIYQAGEPAAVFWWAWFGALVVLVPEAEHSVDASSTALQKSALAFSLAGALIISLAMVMLVAMIQPTGEQPAAAPQGWLLALGFFLAVAVVYLPARLTAWALAGNEPTAIFVEDTVKPGGAQRAASVSAAAVGSSRSLRALFSALPVGVIIADADGNVTDRNALVDNIWSGREAADQSEDIHSTLEPGRDWLLNSGEPLLSQEWALVKALRGGEAVTGEVVDIRRVDGTRGTVITSAAPISDADGKILGAVAIVQDISHQREMEQIAREAARTARRRAVEIEAVFNAQSDAVVLYSPEGVIQQANSRAVAMFGLDPVGMSISQIARRIKAHDEDGEPLPGHLMPASQALEGNSMANKRITFLNARNRSYIALVSAAPVYIGQDLAGAVAIWHDITQRERLLEENRHQRELLERLVREAPVGIAFLTGEDFRFTLVNHAFEHIARGKGELIGRTIAEVWPEFVEPILPDLQDVYASGESVRAVNQPFTIQREHKLEEDYFTYSFVPISDVHLRTEGVMIMIQETTEEVRALQAIDAERARLRAIIEHAPEGILLIDNQGELLLSNLSVERIAGQRPVVIDPESESGFRLLRSDGRRYSLDDLPLIRAAQHGETVFNLEALLETADHRQVPLLLNAAPVQETGGQVIGAVAIFQDISEIRQAERALRESEQRFRSLVESMNDIVFTLDQNLVITGIFGRGLEKIGQQVADALGQRIDSFASGELSVHMVAVQKVMRGESQVYEWSLRRDEQTVFYQNSLAPLFGEDGQVLGVVGVMHDISAMKRTERALGSYATRLKRSNQELEQFAFIASHDLQEPLRKIQVFGQRITRTIGERARPEELDYLDRMIKAADRMQTMIADLLAFSRVTTKGKPFEEVNLNTILQDVLVDLELSIERSQAHVEVEDLPPIEADRMQMRQLFQNLVSNALKYHAQDVQPRVRVYAEMDRQSLDLTTGTEIEQVRILVEDNGIGFEAEYLDRIFRPFERLHGKSEYDGTGMGLAICQKIVERHYGSITAESALGEGATFIVTLPVRQKAAVSNP